MDTQFIIYGISFIAVIMVVILPFIIRTIWTTTDQTFFALLLILYGLICGFVSIVTVYDFITLAV